VLTTSLPPQPPALVISAETAREGLALELNGEQLQAPWRWEEASPPRLWLTLDLLESRLGVEKERLGDGSLKLQWFGRTLQVSSERQRPLQDEVGMEVGELLRAAGVSARLAPAVAGGSTLILELPPARFMQLRTGRFNQNPRLVLDLSGATLLQSQGEQLRVNLINPEAAASALRLQGVAAQGSGGRLLLPAQGFGRLSLGSPARLVLDQFPGGATPTTEREGFSSPLPGLSPAFEQRVIPLGGRRYQLSFVRIDPRRGPFALVPLSRNSMEGLSSLAGLARSQGALAALNGGFFNRIRELPLGGLRDQGYWLSGPILNRGAMAWQLGNLPRFGRVQLEEWLTDPNGNRWPLGVHNSGYAQRGLGHYNRLWGPVYRPITGGETGLILENGRVSEIWSTDRMAGGVPLRQGQMLIVARGGFPLPMQVGDALQLNQRLSPDNFSDLPFLIQGGPLLLADGQVVLDGSAESFSAAFVNQRAPRSVVGSDGEQLWLIALEGLDDPGPTLAEASELMRQLGLMQALNLDGGSSTSLRVETGQGSQGRGIGAAIHNGLGIVVRNPR